MSSTASGSTTSVTIRRFWLPPPKIAAHFIRELRPSALSTMTAAVAAMGYSKIYILGAALSSITTQRPYISVRRRRPTTGVSLSRRYDSWDHTNAEVALLADVATSYPDAVLRDVTVGNRMFPLLKAAKTQPSDHRLIPAPKYPSGFGTSLAAASRIFRVSCCAARMSVCAIRRTTCGASGHWRTHLGESATCR